MNEKELLDMMITERIQILVQEMKSVRTTAERENTRLLMDQAEGILKRLSEQEHALMEQYLVGGKMILQPLGKEFFTLPGKQFFHFPGKHFFHYTVRSFLYPSVSTFLPFP